MGSFQSFKWPYFVIVRDDFIITHHILSIAYMNNYTQCERGGASGIRKPSGG
jgi:hypothetical protein